jgi:RNA ligase (TIGR02306 family)
MRSLASIKKIDQILPIQNAEAIEKAIIGGWQIVIKKGEFKVGELAVMSEIDSWIPTHLAPFLSKGREPREYKGIRGEKLRTIKLRGELSQGLLLPLSILSDYSAEEGEDVSERLGIVKWEAEIPAQLSGTVRGLFPSFIHKTDQERIQNLPKQFSIWKDANLSWEVTEKLDGSSMTVYHYDDNSGVCSRNLDLKKDEANSFWAVAIRENLIEKLQSTGRNLALQGELIGAGIQKNPYGLTGQDFFLYDIWDIDSHSYLLPDERREICKELKINHVPVISFQTKFSNDYTISSLLLDAEGYSVLNNRAEREGLVFKSCDTNQSFKVISNRFLLKGGE